MKLRAWASILIFLSAYSPLSIIFAIQDFDEWVQPLPDYPWIVFPAVEHPWIVRTTIVVSIMSCVLLFVCMRGIKNSDRPVTILNVSNRSGELINYSIPYMISFFVTDLGDKQLALSFLFFMLIMYFLTLKTHNIFVNPILALLGYNLYDVTFVRDGIECESFFLVKKPRLNPGQSCQIEELSEQLYLVTERYDTNEQRESTI